MFGPRLLFASSGVRSHAAGHAAHAVHPNSVCVHATSTFFDLQLSEPAGMKPHDSTSSALVRIAIVRLPLGASPRGSPQLVQLSALATLKAPQCVHRNEPRRGSPSASTLPHARFTSRSGLNFLWAAFAESTSNVRCASMAAPMSPVDGATTDPTASQGRVSACRVAALPTTTISD